MSFLTIKNKLRSIIQRVKDFIELTKLAFDLIKKIDNKLIKIDFLSKFIEQTSSSLAVILLGILLNSIQEKNTEKAYVILITSFVIFFLSKLITSFLNYKYDYLYTFRNKEIFKTLIYKIKEIPVRYRNTPEFIEIETNADIQSIFRFFGQYISLITSFYGVALTFAALSYIEPLLIIFLMILSFISLYFETSANSKAYKMRNERQYYSQLDMFTKENFKIKNLTNLDDNLKINDNLKHLEHLYINVFYKKYQDWYKEFFKNIEGKRLWSSNLVSLGSGLSLVYIYNRGIAGIIQIGSLVVFAQAYERLMSTISNLTWSVAVLFESYLNVKAVSDLMNFEIPKTEYKKIPNLNKLEIEFKNVCFTYPGTKNEVLKDVSFKFEHKDHIGIIGENGAGKSTIINLLFKIYTPTSGSITINGTDIHDISDEDYYKLFSIMGQKATTETGLSFEDCIYLGDTSKPKNIKRIIESAKKAQIHEVINKYEHGYKQLLTHSNFVPVWNKYSEVPFTSLSGGQYRKVLLAKMFYSQKPIYVFDEPTDSIDPESAFKIFKHINEIPHAQMIIFITHDVQRLQLASNKVLVLKDGEVIEFGETDKLIKNKKSELNKALSTYTQTIRE